MSSHTYRRASRRVSLPETLGGLLDVAVWFAACCLFWAALAWVTVG